jgi:hypothetical protein
MAWKILFFCLISFFFFFFFFISVFSFFLFLIYFSVCKNPCTKFQKFQKIKKKDFFLQNLRKFQKMAFLFIQRRWYTNIVPSTMTSINYTLKRLQDRTYKEKLDKLSTIVKFTCAHSQNPCTSNNSTTLTNKA